MPVGSRYDENILLNVKETSRDRGWGRYRRNCHWRSAHIQIVTTVVDSWAYVVNFSETILLIYYGCESLIACSMSSFLFGATGS